MFKKLMSVFIAIAISTVFFASTAHADYYSANLLLKAGVRNAEVVNLQNDLKELGYFHYTSTGYFGEITRQAVIKYQQEHKLMVDGIVGHQTSRQIKVDKVLALAKKYTGVPYVWGGTTPAGFDCSGYTHYVMLQNGIVIPRTAELQYQKGTWVSKSQLQPGDLVFFSTYKPGASHVGFYIGNNQFIHASSSGVKVTSLSNTYYVQRYVGAKRIIQ